MSHLRCLKQETVDLKFGISDLRERREWQKNGSLTPSATCADEFPSLRQGTFALLSASKRGDRVEAKTKAAAKSKSPPLRRARGWGTCKGNTNGTTNDDNIVNDNTDAKDKIPRRACPGEASGTHTSWDVIDCRTSSPLARARLSCWRACFCLRRSRRGCCFFRWARTKW